MISVANIDASIQTAKLYFIYLKKQCSMELTIIPKSVEHIFFFFAQKPTLFLEKPIQVLH